MSSAAVLAAAETEQDRQVELVRMCVAEAGYDPELIQPYPDPASEYTFVSVDGLIPPRVCWRARELAGVGQPKCFACTRRDMGDTGFTGCSADRRFVRACTKNRR